MPSKLAQSTIEKLDNLVHQTLTPTQIKKFQEQATNILKNSNSNIIITVYLHLLAVLVANNHTLNALDNENWLEYFYTRVIKLGYSRAEADKFYDSLSALPVVDNDILKNIDLNDTVDWQLANNAVDSLLQKKFFIQNKNPNS